MGIQPFERRPQSSERDADNQQVSVSPDASSAFLHDGPGEQQASPGSQESGEDTRSHILHEMAQMTAQSFQSSQEAMRVALDMLGRFLDSQTLFVARVGTQSDTDMGTTCDDHIDAYTLRIMEARNIDTSLPAAESEGPLKRTYCQTIWRTHQPLIIEDVTRNPYYQQLATTKEYNIGSYIGVPLLYSDGRVYGTLCSQDPRPRPLKQQPEKLELMQIVARFLISHIEREELITQLRAAERIQMELALREQQARMEADQRFQETRETLDALLTLAESLARLPEKQPASFADTPSSDQTSSLCFTYQGVKQLISVVLHCQDVGILSLDSETATWNLVNKGACDRVQEAPWWQNFKQIFAASQEADMDHLRGNEVVIHTLPPQEGLDTPLVVEAPMFLREDNLLGALVLLFPQNNDPRMPVDAALVKAVARLTGLVYEREHLFLQRAEARTQALALQETNRRFNEFLSIASHELKGPLTGVKGNVQFAQRTLQAMQSQGTQEYGISPTLLKKMQRYLDRAEQQVHVQSRLASDLLDVSRIRAGMFELHMQPCDVGQIIREAVEDQRQVAEGRIIILKQPAEKLLISGDAERLGQVVNNYLTNAHKYSALEMPIKVDITTEGTMVRVTVSDQGPGLTPEAQKHVWERFYRAKNVAVANGNGLGLGLGLHICKTIVEQHGGHVGLQSTSGKGSHFWFILPLSADQASDL